MQCFLGLSGACSAHDGHMRDAMVMSIPLVEYSIFHRIII